MAEKIVRGELISARKGSYLHIDGCLYYKHSSNLNSGVTYWNCRNKGECSARAITTVDLVVLKGPKQSPHDHAPNIEEVDALKIQASIKRVAKEHPEMPPARILRTQLRDVPSEVLAEIPDRLSLRKQISRTRLQNLPPNPTSIHDLDDVPPQFTQTLGGTKFLIYDSFDDDDDAIEGRILIFSTHENLMHLFRSSLWFVDGTFKTAPTIFFQLFSILGAVTQTGINNKPQTIGLPFVHALLENKRRSSYDKVFQVVLKEGRKLGFKNIPGIMSDFEMAIINSAKEYSDCVRCCFFHFCQNIYRHVVSEGLQALYNSEDRQIKIAIHSLCALSFVPLEDVDRHFRELRDTLPDELDDIASFFETTYIIRHSRPKRRSGCFAGLRLQRRSARYPPSMWNQYEAVLQGQARTNNISEGWHNKFQTVVGKHHPSLYAFLQELKKEQADTEILLRQLQLGQRVRKAADKSRREKEEKISNTVQRYHEYLHNNDICTYLRTLGHYIKF